MHKTKSELDRLCNSRSTGVHEVLFSEVYSLISTTSTTDSNIFDSELLKLKRYRTLVDYTDKPFDAKAANNAISLMNSLIIVLSKYV